MAGSVSIDCNFGLCHGGGACQCLGFGRSRIEAYCHRAAGGKGKGLEFDTVVIDCSKLGRGDEEEEKRLLYVNCTRARKRLYLRYKGRPPEIIRKYYPDFLGE